MKIYADAMDQCLLCIDYDFRGDYPLKREVYRKRFQPGIRQKEWWRYQHDHLGLKTFVAYEGIHPLGHIECMPIDASPRPIEGKDLIMIHCVHVVPEAQGRDIGRALLESVMAHAAESGKGLAVIAQIRGSFMPTGFFEHHGFIPVDQRGPEQLLVKRWKGAGPAAFMPIQFKPTMKTEQVCVDYLHCPQCPKSGWALSKMKLALQSITPPVALSVHETGTREAVQELGLSYAVYIDGERAGRMPPQPEMLLDALQDAMQAKRRARH